VALIDIWTTSRSQIEQKHVQQVIAIAGNGHLTDGGSASCEFRAFLRQVPTEILSRYASDCLTTPFPDSGLALQDVANEIGHRLGFIVEPGRYRGIAGEIGLGADRSDRSI